MTRLYIDCLFDLYAEYIIWNARLDESQAEIKIARRNINNLRYADDDHTNGRKWRETKEPLDKGERGEWKNWLKFSFQKNKIMASSPITSWQIVVEKWKQCQILFSWAPKSLQMVTAAVKLKDTCSLDKPRQHIKKQRHNFANKGLYRQSYDFFP